MRQLTPYIIYFFIQICHAQPYMELVPVLTWASFMTQGFGRRSMADCSTTSGSGGGGCLRLSQ